MEYKGYNVTLARQSSMLEIKSKGQGPVPAAIQGQYTSRAEAHKSIDRYLASLLKGKKNGQTKSSSTG